MNKEDSSLREALRLQEGALAHGLPAFSAIAERIEQEPSPLAADRWPVAKGARLTWGLVVAQLRVIPHVVLPAAFLTAAVALASACLMVSAGASHAGAGWWFSALLLLGTAFSLTMALSPERADMLALATPLGPQTVVLARLCAVLAADALAGLAASAAYSWWGALALGAVVAAWLVPLALVAGVAAFAAVWSRTPWAGAAAGAVAVPLVLPAAQSASAGGLWSLVGVAHGALGPIGLAVLGTALLAAAVCSSRSAALARLQTA